MAGKKNKTSRLSYIEETAKHHSKLLKVASRSVSEKIKAAKDRGFFVTYSKGSEIIREYPDGEIEVVGELNAQPLKVEQGTKFEL